jgi:hypothetical protein
MDYLSSSVFITPAWIVLGAVSVLFTRKFLWAYLLSSLLLASISWLSGVAQFRKQRSFDEHEQAVERGQQELNAEFEKLAIALKIPANSPHKMILNRMHTMDAGQATASLAPILSSPRSQSNCQSPTAKTPLFDAPGRVGKER